jgi:hypothetical protein
MIRRGIRRGTSETEVISILDIDLRRDCIDCQSQVDSHPSGRNVENWSRKLVPECVKTDDS